MILFRADGNATVGMGHVMRCLSIADAFRSCGHICVFVLADNTVVNHIQGRGFPYIILNSEYNHMDDELTALKKIIIDAKPEFLIVDSYYITKNYLQELQALTRIAYMDDLCDFAYPVDVLVNYNVYALNMDYHGMYIRENQKFPELLLGPSYAPLRDSFKNLPSFVPKKDCKDILISTGGADPIHLALSIVKHLVKNETLNRKYHILLGAMNPDISEINHLVQSNDHIILHQDVKDMKKLVLSCDVALSAAGSTLYELCACGIPTITYILADNQIPGAEAFERLEVMKSLGDFRQNRNAAELVLQELEALAQDYDNRELAAKRMQSIVDGNGADRLIKCLLKMRGPQDTIEH